MANHTLYVNLLEFTKGKAKGRVISHSIELSFETYTQIFQMGKNVAKMNIVLKKADVLRPKKADTVNEIENRLNDWKEKQRGIWKKSERHHSKVTRKNRFWSASRLSTLWNTC